MKFLKTAALALVCLWASTAAAHHVGGHGGGANYFDPFSSQSRPPRSFAALTVGLDMLDDDLGVVLRYQLSGEYAVNRRFSVGATLPFMTTREDFLPERTSIGDVALVFKGLVWRHPNPTLAVTMGSSVSFPTGDEADGFGTGDVVFSPFVNFAWRLGKVDFYTTLGTSLAAAASVNPGLDFNVGVNGPLIRGAVPIHGFLAFQGSTVFTSDVLEDGSTKAYLTPGLIFYLSDAVITTLGAKISVLDTQRIKSGAALDKTSSILLNDVRVGFNFNINYFF
jgi:hypothetical protein